MRTFIHAVMMSKHTFLQDSRVFEFYGLDLMLDDDLNLWYLECNPSPVM